MHQSLQQTALLAKKSLGCAGAIAACSILHYSGNLEQNSYLLAVAKYYTVFYVSMFSADKLPDSDALQKIGQFTQKALNKTQGTLNHIKTFIDDVAQDSIYNPYSYR